MALLEHEAIFLSPGRGNFVLDKGTAAAQTLNMTKDRELVLKILF
jgi:hypothetical protein